MRVHPNLKRPPIIIAFAILFAAVLYIYPRHLAPSFAGYDHVVKLKSERYAHDFADCVAGKSEGDAKKSLQQLVLSTAYTWSPKDDIVLRSRDKSILIIIDSGIFRAEGISIIARAKSLDDSQIIEGIKECAEASEA